ncbi:ABC-type multidrug transport system, ATPase component [SAR116 cluster alpha proteobacterium HIMB100]|nr:ABC-type multidrug transport system, ATPase component [SAR116 cluster alpha proteobacterium HIMB100]
MTSAPLHFTWHNTDSDANTEMAISARNIVKTYKGSSATGPKQALKGIDLDIPKGGIFGLLGPNGAGKSTFINILGGTVVKTSGHVTIWGTNLDKDPRQARANIGIVPQELNIDVYFTPRELLHFTAGLYGVPAAERDVDAILETVGLTEQANAYARTLSGGMRRRLLVGKAMVHQPPVLVLDEPTAGVDVALRQRLWETIRALNESGVTIVLTTHYLEEAEALCDHVAILNHGQIITSSPKAELLRSAAQKDLSVQLPGGCPQTLPAEIAALQLVRTEAGVKIRFNPNETTAGDILARFIRHDITIGDVSTDEPDLEDIFLQLTSGNDQV